METGSLPGGLMEAVAEHLRDLEEATGKRLGDPESIAFFHEVGLDYVSCSPYRVPVARLVAAQVALAEREKAASVGR